jgi:CubicO group peptidase (beta-lactamase class C family)
MNRLILPVALTLTVLGAACSTGKSGSPAGASSRPSATDTVCQGQFCMKPSVFAKSLHDRLSASVVGHVVLVGDIAYSGGPARQAPDRPELAMGPNVLTNTASVGKMFTTMALLKVLARHRISIDSPILPYLPPEWAKGPNVGTITFHELFTHTAGFRLSSDRVFETDAAAQEQIKLGVQIHDKAEAEYNNINFTIFRDLLPRLEGLPDPGSSRRAAAANRLFINVIQREVLTPAGAGATCAQVAEAVLLYPRPGSSRTPGVMPVVGPSACSAGGWFMTAASMLHVLQAFLAGRILPSSLARQMNEQCLGWDCRPGESTSLRGKTGEYNQGNAAYSTYFGVIMDRVPFVMVANSGPEPTLMIKQAMTDAITR